MQYFGRSSLDLPSHTGRKTCRNDSIPPSTWLVVLVTRCHEIWGGVLSAKTRCHVLLRWAGEKWHLISTLTFRTSTLAIRNLPHQILGKLGNICIAVGSISPSKQMFYWTLTEILRVRYPAVASTTSAWALLIAIIARQMLPRVPESCQHDGPSGVINMMNLFSPAFKKNGWY